MAENQTETPLLQIEDLTAGYGREPVVTGISLSCRAGEIACIRRSECTGAFHELTGTQYKGPLTGGPEVVGMVGDQRQ